MPDISDRTFGIGLMVVAAVIATLLFYIPDDTVERKYDTSQENPVRLVWPTWIW